MKEKHKLYYLHSFFSFKIDKCRYLNLSFISRKAFCLKIIKFLWSEILINWPPPQKSNKRHRFPWQTVPLCNKAIRWKEEKNETEMGKKKKQLSQESKKNRRWRVTIKSPSLYPFLPLVQFSFNTREFLTNLIHPTIHKLFSSTKPLILLST